MHTKIIEVKDFHITKGSGEKFKEDVLLPALNKARLVVIDFTGARGYTTDFLREAFSGLTPEEVLVKTLFCAKRKVVAEIYNILISEEERYVKKSN